MIQIEQMKLRFEDRMLFDRFDLRAESGEKVLLSGPSGTGKSTLFKVLLGYVHPENGRIVLLGTELNRNTVQSLRRRMAEVQQNVDMHDDAGIDGRTGRI